MGRYYNPHPGIEPVFREAMQIITDQDLWNTLVKIHPGILEATADQQTEVVVSVCKNVYDEACRQFYEAEEKP